MFLFNSRPILRAIIDEEVVSWFIELHFVLCGNVSFGVGIPSLVLPISWCTQGN